MHCGNGYWLRDLEEEIRLINELPFVKMNTLTFRESELSSNLNKVEVAVCCCWSGCQFKRPVMNCDKKEKPTHLEAARALRLELIAKHGQAGHPLHPSAARRRAALEEAGVRSSPPPHSIACDLRVWQRPSCGRSQQGMRAVFLGFAVRELS